ncbi:glycosyltransferase WbsX family protein [Desertivirga xinjiangensis]|uniref:glycosyltransferase WbsX family protein n=1 Tax=Desertivirga xinjiangensis TaxID=539206 RepID=UPI00210E5B13|nr:glycoside hydrolase family 99-like domain-containing protein [Pedobacter xinjiangensis]
MGNYKIRTIAIHLPQFHPIPENDKWWGKGFTEWTNVAKAKPLFKGHYQPHLPADLGFYDLRLSEVREQQAELAKIYGIYGFCYYHYWFNGKRVLERPVNDIIESGKPDFPFMLCWANENWTRAWNGSEYDVLLQQNYSEEDDLNHIRYLIEIFKDKRYIRINNKPVIAIYRSTRLPDVEKTVSLWRKEAAKHDMELYICRFESFSEIGKEYLEQGKFDSAIEFQPVRKLTSAQKETQSNRGIFYKVKKSIFYRAYKRVPEAIKPKFYLAENYGDVIDYEIYVEDALKIPQKDYKSYPCVTPMWDNSARKSHNFLVFKNSSPAIYERWLSETIKRFTPPSAEENFVFINAWNEWAEGNHLEPCQKWGHQYLEATERAIKSTD